MEKKGLVRIHVVVICAVVGVFGLITVILGVAGEASTAQSLVAGDGVNCKYRTTPAVGCGIVAALLAWTAQIVVTAAVGCCGLYRTWGIPTETKRIVAIALSAVAWVVVIINVVLFIVGAVANKGGNTQATDDGKCLPAPGIEEFAAATVLSLVAVGFQITSYILLQATAASSAKPHAEQQSGIAVGQPMQPEPQDADQRAAAGGDPPTPAPTSLSESRAEPTSQV